MWWHKGVDVVGHASLCCRGCHPIAPLPLLPRSSSSFCLCCLRVLVALSVCTMCTRGVFCLFFVSRRRKTSACLCMFCEHTCFHWPQCLCARVYVRACVRASCTVWNHSRLQQYWAPCPASLACSGRNKRGRSFPAHHQALRALKFIRSMSGVNFFPQLTVWATEHEFWQKSSDFASLFDLVVTLLMK